MKARTKSTFQRLSSSVFLSLAITLCTSALALDSTSSGEDQSRAALISRLSQDINRKESMCPHGCYVREVPTKLIKHGVFARAIRNRDFHFTSSYYGLLPNTTVELRVDDLATFHQFLLKAGVDRRPGWRESLVSLYMEIVIRKEDRSSVQEVPEVIEQLEKARIELAGDCAKSIRDALMVERNADLVAVITPLFPPVELDWYEVDEDLGLTLVRTEHVCDDLGMEALERLNREPYLSLPKTPSSQE